MEHVKVEPLIQHGKKPLLCFTCDANGDLKKCLQLQCKYYDTFIMRILQVKLRKIAFMKKNQLWINSIDVRDDDMDKCVHGWNDVEHMKITVMGFLKSFHVIIRTAMIDANDCIQDADFAAPEHVDKCYFCPAKKNLQHCLVTECDYKSNFAFKQLSTKLRRVLLSTENQTWLENFTDPYTVQHHGACYEGPLEDIYEYCNIDEHDPIKTEMKYLDACNHSWADSRYPVKDDSNREPLSSGEYCVKCGKTRPGNFTDVDWSNDLPDYGDLMDLQEFVEACQCGGFINYDGSGHYCNGDNGEANNVPARPGNITRDRIEYRFSHVMWYNR